MLALQTTDLEAEWMGAQRICKLGEQPFAWQYEENRTRNLGDQVLVSLGVMLVKKEVVHQLGFSLQHDSFVAILSTRCPKRNERPAASFWESFLSHGTLSQHISIIRTKRYTWGVPKIGVPKNGRFTRDYPIISY